MCNDDLQSVLTRLAVQFHFRVPYAQPGLSHDLEQAATELGEGEKVTQAPQGAREWLLGSTRQHSLTNASPLKLR